MIKELVDRLLKQKARQYPDKDILSEGYLIALEAHRRISKIQKDPEKVRNYISKTVRLQIKKYIATDGVIKIPWSSREVEYFRKNYPEEYEKMFQTEEYFDETSVNFNYSEILYNEIMESRNFTATEKELVDRLLKGETQQEIVDSWKRSRFYVYDMIQKMRPRIMRILYG